MVVCDRSSFWKNVILGKVTEKGQKWPQIRVLELFCIIVSLDLMILV